MPTTDFTTVCDPHTRTYSTTNARGAMPAATSDKKLAAAVLHSLESGSIPDLETVASGELSSSSLPTVVEELSRVRETARTEIKAISKNVAPDVDGWIEQTRQLQRDIEASKATAHEIVQSAQHAKKSNLDHIDKSQKVELLRHEVDFNSRLGGILEDVRDLATGLGHAQDRLAEDKTIDSLRQLRHVESSLKACDAMQTTAPIEILQQRTSRLRSMLVEQVQKQWDNAICFDKATSSLSVRNINYDHNNGRSVLHSLVDLCNQLELLDVNLKRFCKDLDGIIVQPCINTSTLATAPSLKFDTNSISVVETHGKTSPQQILQDLAALVERLHEWMPFATEIVSKSLMPSITSRLLYNHLNPSVPTSVESLGEYQTLLTQTASFAAKLSKSNWTDTAELEQWVEQAPRVWLAKRREASLADIRGVLQHNLDQRKTVEHVETQEVSEEDVLPTHDGADDDWNDWNEEESKTDVAQEASANEEQAIDEGAWGWEEENKAEQDEAKPDLPKFEKEAIAEGDESAAWGWDEQDAEDAPPVPTKLKTVEEARNVEKVDANSQSGSALPQKRELTLRESYTTTAVPEAILAMIVDIASDAQKLKTPEFSESPVADAVNGLYAVPTLALAGFRALAPTFYQNLVAGNMLLYNDSMRVSKELKSFAQGQSEEDAASGQAEKTWPSTRMKLEAEITALESFGRRAYGKEMDSQRTILRDLLDDTQGFANCAEAPFAGECDSAVSRTAERIRTVAKEWDGVLSRSALLQSLGSLLAIVIGKMITDIEDMADIAEDESKQLRKFCKDMSQLSDLFRQDSGSDGPADVTGIYTPNWFKFQYLSEIMESSLADIRYLWTEGELSLEFEPEELEDLIMALFAESDHRRKAIAEIKRS